MSIEVNSNVKKLLFQINKFVSSEQFVLTFEDEFCFGKQSDTSLLLENIEFTPSNIKSEKEAREISLYEMGYDSANGVLSNENSDKIFNSFLIKTYINSNPNAAKVILDGEKLILVNSNNLPVKDDSGNIVQINYNKNSDKPNSDLITFYLEHNDNQLDIKTLLYLQIIQEKTQGLSKNDKNYENFWAEIEKAKIGIMEDDEKNEYIISALQNSLSQKDTDFFLILLGVINIAKIEKINNLLNKNTGNNFFEKNLPIIYCLNSQELQTQLKEFFTPEEGITKKDSIKNIIKTVDSTLDTLITDFHALNKLNRSQLREKIEQIPIIGNDFCSSLKSYFNQQKSPNNLTNLNDYKQLDSKTLRENIKNTNDLTELNQIRDFIDKQSFTKAEKEILKNECYKQQGNIQNIIRNKEEVKMPGQLIEQNNKQHDIECRTRSHIEFHIFEHCKNPIQREFALFILNNKPIYMVKDLNFEEIINNCNSKEDLSIKIRFLEKIIDTHEFYDSEGNLNKDAVLSINDKSPEVSALKLNILSEYVNSKNNLSPASFLKSLKNVHDPKEAYVMLNNISSEKRNAAARNNELVQNESENHNNKEINTTNQENIAFERIHNDKTTSNNTLSSDVNINKEQYSDYEINHSERSISLNNIKISEQKDYNLKLYTECGLQQKDAELLINTISSKNINNTSAHQASFKLIDAGFSVKSILNLLSAATASGTFNQEIIDDAIVINKTGVNTYIGENISVIKNSDNTQIKALMGPKKLRDIKDKLYILPKNTKAFLKSNNIDINEILIKIRQIETDSDVSNNKDIEIKQQKYS